MTKHTKGITQEQSQVSPSKRDPIAAWLDVFIRMLSLSKSDSAAVRDELEDHLRSRVDDLLITGSSEHDAVRRAVSELGETADLARRFKHASHPSRRRNLMSTALIAIAGSALTLGAYTAFTPPPIVTTTAAFASGAGGAHSLVMQPGEAAPFDENLKKYNIAVFYAEDLEGRWGEMYPDVRTERIARTIQDLVSNDLWVDRGGNGASISVTGNTMFITGPAETHAGVEWVLETLIADLESERRAYLEKIERRKAERNATAEEMQAFQERLRIEKQHQREQAMAQADANRIQQIQELREQYEQLSDRYIELTREMARLDLESERDDELWDTVEQRANGAFTNENNQLASKRDDIRNKLGSEIRRLKILKERDSTTPQDLEQSEKEIQALTAKKKANSSEFTIIREKIRVQADLDRDELTGRLAAMRAREAELRLSYEDTEIRLVRIRSMLLDLEMAEYTNAFSSRASSMLSAETSKGLARRREALDRAVENGTLTREKADEMMDRAIENAVVENR